MGSFQRDKTDTAVTQFIGPDGKRRTIRLGKISDRDASRFVDKLDRLRAAVKLGNPPDEELIAWAKRLDEETADKLAGFGLLSPRQKKAPIVTVGQLLAAYFADHSETKKPATIVNWNHTKRCLLAFFESEKPKRLADVTEGDAKAFERFLRSAKARENRYVDATKADGLQGETVRKRISNSKQFFDYAVDHRLIESNPFEELKSSVGSNRSRDFFVTRAAAAKVLAACPDNEWCLLFALARFGGLRCPSEHLALRWGDVDLPGGRMTVRSPKTEHHEGKESRVVPIFPELRPYLEAANDDAPEMPPLVGAGATEQERVANAQAREAASFVIRRYRDAGTNLRTHLLRIIGRAGIAPWPKLWQNLRASCETELVAVHPAHVAAAWLGHSVAVARKHYLQVTDADFDKAITKPAGEPVAAIDPAPGSKSLAKALHTGDDWGAIGDDRRKGDDAKPAESRVQLSPIVSNISDQWAIQDANESPTSRKIAGAAGEVLPDCCTSAGAGDRVAEPCQTDNGGGSAGPVPAAVGSATPPRAALPADLARVVDAWPRLTEGERASVLAVVDGAGGDRYRG